MTAPLLAAEADHRRAVPGEGAESRSDDEDDEPGLVHPHPAVHVAEPAHLGGEQRDHQQVADHNPDHRGEVDPQPAFDLGQGQDHDRGVDRGDEHAGHDHRQAEVPPHRPGGVGGERGRDRGWCGAHGKEDTVGRLPGRRLRAVRGALATYRMSARCHRMIGWFVTSDACSDEVGGPMGGLQRWLTWRNCSNASNLDAQLVRQEARPCRPGRASRGCCGHRVGRTGGRGRSAPRVSGRDPGRAGAGRRSVKGFSGRGLLVGDAQHMAADAPPGWGLLVVSS
jgi:hypothetical protein